MLNWRENTAPFGELHPSVTQAHSQLKCLFLPGKLNDICQVLYSAPELLRSAPGVSGLGPQLPGLEALSCSRRGRGKHRSPRIELFQLSVFSKDLTSGARTPVTWEAGPEPCLPVPLISQHSRVAARGLFMQIKYNNLFICWLIPSFEEINYKFILGAKQL